MYVLGTTLGLYMTNSIFTTVWGICYCLLKSYYYICSLFKQLSVNSNAARLQSMLLICCKMCTKRYSSKRCSQCKESEATELWQRQIRSSQVGEHLSKVLRRDTASLSAQRLPSAAWGGGAPPSDIFQG